MSPEPTRVGNVADWDSAVFLAQWLRTPGQIGAIAPSSSRLARAISTAIPEHGDPVVVELGAGTGPFTAEIQRRLAGRGRHLAVEVNPKLAQLLRDRFTQAEVIEDDARLLPSLLDERGLRHADVVISSLPWTMFEPTTQYLLLKAVLDVLAPHSVFSTFAYLHAAPMAGARRFRELSAQHFEEVISSRTVWRNLPPAFVLHARRPRLHARFS
ncbi:MAG: SAM-dependent methyltransferase [Mycobacterium sp.]|jgi:phospholipid N-methyltransferase|nr:SAM-dependent methyltransferase [Mycobacterium sp.]